MRDAGKRDKTRQRSYPEKYAVMLITIPEKSTHNRLSGNFGANVANATKQTKHRIIRRVTKKLFERNGTLKSSRRLQNNEIDGGRDSLSPEMRRKGRSDHHYISS
jgi:hypothetical protein